MRHGSPTVDTELPSSCEILCQGSHKKGCKALVAVSHEGYSSRGLTSLDLQMLLIISSAIYIPQLDADFDL